MLRLTIAFLTAPETFTPAVWAELRSYYFDEQVAELMLDLVRFRRGSKLMVAAGFEPEGDQLVRMSAQVRHMTPGRPARSGARRIACSEQSRPRTPRNRPLNVWVAVTGVWSPA